MKTSTEKNLLRANSGEQERGISISQLANTQKAIIPTSKVFWGQARIARDKEAVVGVLVDARGTYITAGIHDGRNNPLELDNVQLGIQVDLGDLILTNGKPLTLSIAQIVRAALHLSPDENPSDEQLATFEKALDAMLTASAQIDFQAQLEAHQRLKRKPEEDYKKMFGTLVSGIKLSEKVTHNGVEVSNTSYQIFDMPMFMRYSYLVDQIATVNKAVLASGGGAKTLPDGHPDKRRVERTAANEVVKTYFLSQLHAEKTRAFKVAFETVADRCGIDVSTRQRMRTFRSNVNAILRDFTAGGAIADFKEYTKGKKTEGVEVT